MINSVHFTVLLIFSIYIVIRTIAYAIYEIKEKKNKFGGISVIVFCLISVLSCLYIIFVSIKKAPMVGS